VNPGEVLALALTCVGIPSLVAYQAGRSRGYRDAIADVTARARHFGANVYREGPR
jgi:hypothetical protein